MDKIVLITGASSGIGEGCARKFASEGARLILNARSVDKLEALAQDLKEKYGTSCYVMPFDVRDRKAASEALASLPAEWQAIDVLINNAGLVIGVDKEHEGNLDEWDIVIDTNIKSLLSMTRMVVPGMVERGRGHIINIGSIAGTEPYENGAVYCASKHAVHAISQAMRADLLSAGIKVGEVRPGMVETEFSEVRFHGDKERAAGVYKGVEALQGEDIAEAIHWMLSLPAHMNVNDIVLMPTCQAGAYYTYRK